MTVTKTILKIWEKDHSDIQYLNLHTDKQLTYHPKKFPMVPYGPPRSCLAVHGSNSSTFDTLINLDTQSTKVPLMLGLIRPEGGTQPCGTWESSEGVPRQEARPVTHYQVVVGLAPKLCKGQERTCQLCRGFICPFMPAVHGSSWFGKTIKTLRTETVRWRNEK